MGQSGDKPNICVNLSSLPRPSGSLDSSPILGPASHQVRMALQNLGLRRAEEGTSGEPTTVRVFQRPQEWSIEGGGDEIHFNELAEHQGLWRVDFLDVRFAYLYGSKSTSKASAEAVLWYDAADTPFGRRENSTQGLTFSETWKVARFTLRRPDLRRVSLQFGHKGGDQRLQIKDFEYRISIRSRPQD
jgi:hypothetical protein